MVSRGLRSRCFTTGRLRWDFRLTCPPSGRRDCLPPLRRLWQLLRSVGLVGNSTATESSPFASPFLVAPLIFSTSVAAIGFARAAGPDMLFSAALTVAMASGAIVLSRRGALRSENDNRASTGPSDHFALAVFGASLGLAVLAKGPAGVVLAAGAIGIWAIATSQWRSALRLAHPIAIIAFCVVALPWYVLCAARNPDFIHIFIFQHNFERYLTPIFQHRQPFWYFVPILLLGLLPWTACLWPSAPRRVATLAAEILEQFAGILFCLLGYFPFSVFQLFAIETTGIYPSRDSFARSSDCGWIATPDPRA